MSISLSDLQPKPFKVTIRGVELECKPLRLSHALTLSKVGEVFQNPKSTTKEEVKKAEAEMDELAVELIPELAGIQLDVGSILDLISQMMVTVTPSDNKELNDKGVKLNSDPKAEKIG
jgi:hypothetical protein